MKNIYKYYTAVTANSILAISAYIVLSIVIITICLVIDIFIVDNDDAREEDKSYSPLIDVDENQWKFSRSSVYYLSNGVILADLKGDGQIRDMYEYDPDDHSFFPASTDYANSLLSNARCLNGNDWLGEYKTSNCGILSEDLIIPSDTPDGMEVWKYDIKQKIYTGYIKSEPIGCLSESGFANISDLAKPMIGKRPFIWTEVYRSGSTEKYRTYMLYQGESGLYLIDFLNKEFNLLVAYGQGSNLMEWTVYSRSFLNSSDQGPGMVVLMYDNKAPDILLNTRNGFERHEVGIPDIGYSNYKFDVMFSIDTSFPAIYLLAQTSPGYSLRNESRDSCHAALGEALFRNEAGVKTNIAIKGKYYLYEVDVQSWQAKELLNYEHLTLVGKRPDSEPYSQRMKFEYFPNVLMPVAGYKLAEYLYAMGFISEATAGNFPRIYYAILPETYVLSLTCVVLAWLHLRNRQRNKIEIFGWLLFVLLFNVAGLVVYWLKNNAKVVSCEACGNKRSFLSNACPHCNAGLPRPQSRLTDIIVG